MLNPTARRGKQAAKIRARAAENEPPAVPVPAAAAVPAALDEDVFEEDAGGAGVGMAHIANAKKTARKASVKIAAGGVPAKRASNGAR